LRDAVYYSQHFRASDRFDKAKDLSEKFGVQIGSEVVLRQANSAAVAVETLKQSRGNFSSVPVRALSAMTT